MSRTRNTIIGALTAALVAAALAHGAGAQDLRSPDARDAAQTSRTTQTPDLRSPDAQDAALASQARSYQDLRSPDARDAGQPHASPSPTPTGDSTGTNWDDVGIIAGGVLALIGLGGLFLFDQRHGSARKSRAPAASS
jgi:hypothetical protein